MKIDKRKKTQQGCLVDVINIHVLMLYFVSVVCTVCVCEDILMLKIKTDV